MPILRLKEIGGMSSDERSKKLSELRAELSRLRTMVRAGGAVENPARIRELRKTIAKVLTVEPEKPAKAVKKVKKTKETKETKQE
jgi:large subunit ribosomal protein L29